MKDKYCKRVDGKYKALTDSEKKNVRIDMNNRGE